VGADAPFFEICDAFFIEHDVDGGFTYEFPSARLERLAARVSLLAHSVVPAELHGDEQPTLELVCATMVYFKSFEYTNEARIGNAAGGDVRVTLPDFPVVQAEATKALNWMANPSFCPSR